MDNDPIRDPAPAPLTAGLPLAGITVVSVEQAVAAPFATRQLADLGARVIKVERPGSGDFARQYDATVKGLASYFVWLNRSKQSLSLDIKQRRGPFGPDQPHRPLGRVHPEPGPGRGGPAGPVR